MLKQKLVAIMMVSAFALFTCNTSFANDYKLDDASIETLFTEALEMTDFDFNFATASGGSASFNTPNPWAAAAICWFVGGFGIHRHYLGTSPNMWAIYTFTVCGIFGIVPIVDFIVLIVGAVTNDYSKYVGNTSFFMW
ncbi:MAG: TM2 domain-containing protein [Bacteroidales bacterium]|nr:TM2 domain-containing protein [Bacteroidales bacterium]